MKVLLLQILQIGCYKKIVSQCWINYFNKEDKVLLIKSERRGWEFPGGVLEQGESIFDGLKREIFEESGIIAEPEKFVGRRYNHFNNK